jgi:hypothetical protein
MQVLKIRAAPWSTKRALSFNLRRQLDFDDIRAPIG